MGIVIENWYMFIVVIAVLFLLGSSIFMFFKLPTDNQLEKVKAWLLLAVTQAEVELGGGTGRLKLRFVYDLFITRFVWISRLISFEYFSLLVDEALEEMRMMLETNEAVKTLVEGDA
jgi:hypothetical protein